MRRYSQEIVTVAAVISGCIALALGSWLIFTGVVDRAVRRDAEYSAMAWARHLGAQLPDLREIAAGAAPLPSSHAAIEQAARVGNVFRFKIFDAQGQLRLVSDELGRRWDSEPSLAIHNPPAAAVVRTGQPYTEVKQGTPPRRPPLYAETYLPIAVNGEVIGIVEVYLDQTGKLTMFREQFAVAGLALAGLVALAFGIPFVAYHVSSRQKRRADERIRFLAEHDGMTALANRAAFLAASEAAFARRGADRVAGIHLVDLDRFKTVNDTLGHDVGDELIRIAAERLRRCVPRGCLVARLGGDEFAVLQTGAAGDGEVEALGALIQRELSQPATVLRHHVLSTATVGSCAATDARTVAALMKNADLALYAAKSEGGAASRLFTPDLEEHQRQRVRIETLIRRAADEGVFDLHFQPIVDGGTGTLASFEALLRLPSEDGPQPPPDVFVPIAEEMGLIGVIGAKVLERACATAALWPPHITVSVNLSPLQFADGKLSDAVSRALVASGLEPRRLELEITEGLLLSDTDAVLAQLSAIKALGVRIAMDDFGTGYSSLSYLWRFPFDKIKIDRSFMRAFSNCADDAANVLKTIVSLGHSLRMEVTAEGVETAPQAEFLKGLSCDYIQGFLYGRPLPVTEVAARLLDDLPEREAPRAPRAAGLVA